MRLFDLWGQRGWADHDVVGESHYFDHIRSLLPKPDGDESEAQTVAQLVPEPSNIHDPNAVAVKCGGGVVGYLSRDEASVYFPILSALVAQGWMPQVAARIWGGHRSAYDYDNGTLVDGRDFIGSVRLDLAEPHLIVPVNTPPSDPHVLLPQGGAIQVSGEEAHLDTLTPWLRPEGECWIYVTLHEVVESAARGTRTVVEVRVDGDAAGKLTPKMSGEYLPVIHLVAEQGSLTTARAILKGNRIKADLVLRAARSNQLSASWLDSLAAPGPDNRVDQVALVHVGDADGAATSQTQRVVADGPDLWIFNPPPGWPPPPLGWAPAAGWCPDPTWPPAPSGWAFWLPSSQARGVHGIDPIEGAGSVLR